MEEIFQSCTQEDVEGNKNTDDTPNDNSAVSVGIKEYHFTFTHHTMTDEDIPYFYSIKSLRLQLYKHIVFIHCDWILLICYMLNYPSIAKDVLRLKLLRFKSQGWKSNIYAHPIFKFFLQVYWASQCNLRSRVSMYSKCMVIWFILETKLYNIMID